MRGRRPRGRDSSRPMLREGLTRRGRPESRDADRVDGAPRGGAAARRRHRLGAGAAAHAGRLPDPRAGRSRGGHLHGRQRLRLHRSALRSDPHRRPDRVGRRLPRRRRDPPLRRHGTRPDDGGIAVGGGSRGHGRRRRPLRGGHGERCARHRCPGGLPASRTDGQATPQHPGRRPAESHRRRARGGRMTASGTLMRSEIEGLPLIHRGKVRETYEVDDRHLLLVATDRLSAFDVVFEQPIPDKGAVLTRLSAWWLEQLAGLGRSHFVSADRERLPEPARTRELSPRSMLVRRAERVDAECVVRGYLAGSGWAEYGRTGAVCGHRLPDGLREADRLPEPIFTPSTKAEVGHDENISRQQLADLVGADLAQQLEERSIALYAEGARRAEAVGLILADTKFEFGFIDGSLAVIDEVLTPDSSRFWDAEQYAPGSSPQSFDKQFVRDFVAATGWNKEPPAPTLPDEVIAGTRDRYVAAFERLTGRPWEASA